MSDTGRRNYGGETADQRVERRRDALIRAAIDLVGERGWAGLRVESVCAAAGLNNRYYYQSFGNLDALAVAMIDRLADEILELVVVDDLSVPAPELIRSMVETLVTHAAEHPGRVRVLFDDVGSTPAAAQRRAAAIRRIVDTLVLDGRIVHQSTDPIIEISASVLVNGSIRVLLDWLDGRLDVAREQFVNQLVVIWMSAILAARPASG